MPTSPSTASTLRRTRVQRSHRLVSGIPMLWRDTCRIPLVTFALSYGGVFLGWRDLSQSSPTALRAMTCEHLMIHCFWCVLARMQMAIALTLHSCVCVRARVCMYVYACVCVCVCVAGHCPGAANIRCCTTSFTLGTTTSTTARPTIPLLVRSHLPWFSTVSVAATTMFTHSL